MENGIIGLELRIADSTNNGRLREVKLFPCEIPYQKNRNGIQFYEQLEVTIHTTNGDVTLRLSDRCQQLP